MTLKPSVFKYILPLAAIVFVLLITGIFMVVSVFHIASLGSLNSNGSDGLKILGFLLIAEVLVLVAYLAKGLSEIQKAVKKTQIIYEEKEKMIEHLSGLYNDVVDYDQMKTEFFSNISHDLKTPLSVILGAIQLIDQGTPKNEDRRRSSKHMRTVRQNCYRLIRLVNNLLDITKMDSGFMKSHFTNCNIIYVVEEIVQSVVPFAEQKGITLEFDTEAEEVMTGVDIEKFERIILNLLSNAIKFTPADGMVSVRMGTREEKILISVKDTGVGIPRDMQSQVFDRFKQVGSALTKDFEGTGIGLALVKSFVELHQGSIRLESEEGCGSEFVIEIPINLVEETSEGIPNGENRQNKMLEAIHIEFSDLYSRAS